MDIRVLNRELGRRRFFSASYSASSISLSGKMKPLRVGIRVCEIMFVFSMIGLYSTYKTEKTDV